MQREEVLPKVSHLSLTHRGVHVLWASGGHETMFLVPRRRTVVTGDTDVMKPATVLYGVEASGTNTATWNPTLSVSLPSDSLPGTYQGTVTTSVV